MLKCAALLAYLNADATLAEAKAASAAGYTFTTYNFAVVAGMDVHWRYSTLDAFYTPDLSAQPLEGPLS